MNFSNETKILYHTKFLDLKSTKSPTGNDWFYAHRANVSNVVVLIPVIHAQSGDKIIFIETQRPPLYAEGKGLYNIELPAGLVGDIDKNETVLEAIKKELLEETGYNADKITILTDKVSSSSGCTSETLTFALVEIYNDEIKQEPQDDGAIILKRHCIELSEVKNWLKMQEKDKKTLSTPMLAGLFFLTMIDGYSL